MDLESMIMESMMESYLGGLASAGVDMSIAMSLIGIFSTVVSIFFFVVSIAFIGGMLTRISHKLNVFEKEALAYIPIVRDCYRMRMVGYHPLLGLLINEAGIIMTAIISCLLLLLFKSFILFTIVLIAGLVANYFFTYKYYNKILKSFGFEGTLALLVFIPGSAFALDVIGMVVAFSDKFENRMIQSVVSKVNNHEEKIARLEKIHSKNESDSETVFQPAKSTIYGTKGKYSGSKFEISDGETVTIGRDTQRCNIVYDDKYTGVSRNHCAVRFSAAENGFYVTDNSSNGTFINGTLKIGHGNTKKVDVGTIICLGDDSNSFRLG